MSSSDERRKGFWDEEEGSDEENEKSSRNAGHAPQGDPLQIDAKLHDAVVLLEQTHQLYQHYFNGIESRPPAEKAQLLERKSQELLAMASSGTSNRFKVGQFIQQFNVMKDLWSRKLREKERK